MVNYLSAIIIQLQIKSAEMIIIVKKKVAVEKLMDSHVDSCTFLSNKGGNYATGPWLIRGILVLVFFITSLILVSGQQVNQLETDRGIAASIAPYNADVRQAILEVSLYPAALTALQKSQSQTVESFHDITGGFDQKKQAWFYTITRYPELMHILAALPDKQDKESVYKLLPNQDADLKEAAWKLYDTKKKDIIKLDNLNMVAQQDFNKTIQNLDPATREAFKKLSAMPDVLTLLTK